MPLAAYLREYISTSKRPATVCRRRRSLSTDPDAGRRSVLPDRTPAADRNRGRFKNGGVFNGIQAPSVSGCCRPKYTPRTVRFRSRSPAPAVEDALRFMLPRMMLDVAPHGRRWSKALYRPVFHHGINKLQSPPSGRRRGWRIEIRSHLELTEIGGFAAVIRPCVRPTVRGTSSHGGYYT